MPPESLGADWQMWQVAAQARMVLELDAGVPLGFFLNEEVRPRAFPAATVGQAEKL